MGVKPAKAPANLTPKQLAQITKENDTAQSALTKRVEALDSTIGVVDDRLANDQGLEAYPDAKVRLEGIKASAENGKSVIAQEQEIRERLGEAAKSGDQAGVKQAQSDLTALKKSNPKIYGKGSTASPKVECPNELSTVACDTAISNVNYLGTKGPSSPLSPNSPCYGSSLDEWDGWDEMIAHGCATAEERDMITAMSANEGSFEAVQSYDSQVLTFGAMQKTVNTTGGGEFSDQLAAFKNKDADSYQRLFADHGWTVEGGKTYYQDAAGTKRTGSDLQAYLRSASHSDQAKVLGPLRSAGRDPAFRKQQICDFINRANVATSRKVKVGSEKYLAGDFLTSTKGKAMLLDSSVNAGQGEKSFQKTVDWFYKAHPHRPERTQPPGRPKSVRRTKPRFSNATQQPARSPLRWRKPAPNAMPPCRSCPPTQIRTASRRSAHPEIAPTALRRLDYHGPTYYTPSLRMHPDLQPCRPRND